MDTFFTVQPLSNSKCASHMTKTWTFIFDRQHSDQSGDSRSKSLSRRRRRRREKKAPPRNEHFEFKVFCDFRPTMGHDVKESLKGVDWRRVFHIPVLIVLQGTTLKTFLSQPVWPDLAKFRHFGKNLQVFGKLLTVRFFFGKMLSLLWQICDITGRFSLWQMAKYWNISQPSGHTAADLKRD